MPWRNWKSRLRSAKRGLKEGPRLPLDLAALLPASLDPLAALALIVLSFFTSALTATFGLGGGSLMIAAMVLVLPPLVAVPVHGLVQLGSNAGRALLMRPHIQWRFAGFFVLGSIPGALLGAQVAVWLPEAIFTLVIAAFILWSAWAPQPKVEARGRMVTAIAGLVTATIGMVTGVAGPLVIAFLRFLPDRRQVVATHAALMTAQNVLKAAAFTAFGFAFASYLPFVAAMIASGFAGTATGGMFLSRLPESAFRIGFRLLLTIVAIGLLVEALV